MQPAQPAHTPAQLTVMINSAADAIQGTKAAIAGHRRNNVSYRELMPVYAQLKVDQRHYYDLLVEMRTITNNAPILRIPYDQVMQGVAARGRRGRIPPFPFPPNQPIPPIGHANYQNTLRIFSDPGSNRRYGWLNLLGQNFILQGRDKVTTQGLCTFMQAFLRHSG